MKISLRDKKNITSVLFASIVLLGLILRFYKIDWGEGYYFHPDEYHIAAAVDRLDFPNNMNPKLFSYGSSTVYLIYFTKAVLGNININLATINPILVGRFYSALFSTLTIIVVLLLTYQITKNEAFAALAAFLFAVLPGAIQQAHFTTPESFVTFWLLLSLLLIVKAVSSRVGKFMELSAVAFGIAVATKISSLIFLPILLIAPFVQAKTKLSGNKLAIVTLHSIKLGLIAFFITIFIFPHIFLDHTAFISSMRYETGVGGGNPVVFYTRQFINTTPIAFQFTKILPYTLGVGVLLLGLAGILLALIKLFRTLKTNRKLFLVVLTFLLLFLTNSFFFAKWTRFIAPTFPFWCIFSSYLLFHLFGKPTSPTRRKLATLLLTLVLLTTTLWSSMFFSIYSKVDVRITATRWIQTNIPKGSVLLTESGNTLDVPLWGIYTKKVFDFYTLEENPINLVSLATDLEKSDYFIIQSRRVFVNHTRLIDNYPKSANFYKQLLNGELGFVEIKEFDSFPELQIGAYKIDVNDELAEETWSVFDHPVIRIYKKTKPNSLNYYEKIINNQ
jgi:hypothetical protein